MTDPTIVPPHLRRQALIAAMSAVEGVLDREGIQLDLFARCELLETALDEYHQHLEAQLPPEPLEN